MSFHPSEEIILDIYVLEKTTDAYGLHARPNHTLPVPYILQFTKENPVFSASDVLSWAVMQPLIPEVLSFAMDLIVQSCLQFEHCYIPYFEILNRLFWLFTW